MADVVSPPSRVGRRQRPRLRRVPPRAGTRPVRFGFQSRGRVPAEQPRSGPRLTPTHHEFRDAARARADRRDGPAIGTRPALLSTLGETASAWVHPLGHVEGTNAAGGSRGRRRRGPCTPRHQNLRARAGDGNRTHITSLEDWPAGFQRTTVERSRRSQRRAYSVGQPRIPPATRRTRDGRAIGSDSSTVISRCDARVDWRGVESRFDRHAQSRRSVTPDARSWAARYATRSPIPTCR